MARTGKNSGSRLDRHSIRAQFTGPLEWTRIAIRRRRLQRSGRDGDGAMPFSPDGAPLARGYATFGDDSGHNGSASQANFGLLDEAVSNFGYAHLKKVHDVALALIERGYGRRPELMRLEGWARRLHGDPTLSRRLRRRSGECAGVELLRAAADWPADRAGRIQRAAPAQMPRGVPPPSRSNGCKRERAGQACSVSRILSSRFPGPHSCRTGTCFLRAMLTSSISSRMTRRSIRRTSMSCGRDVTVNKWSGCRRRSVRLDDWVTHGVAPETLVVTDIAQATNGRTRRCAGIRRFRGMSGKGKPIGPVVLFVRGSEAIRVSWGALAAWLQLESKY